MAQKILSLLDKKNTEQISFFTKKYYKKRSKKKCIFNLDFKKYSTFSFGYSTIILNRNSLKKIFNAILFCIKCIVRIKKLFCVEIIK